MAGVICFRNDPYCTTLYYAQMDTSQARFIHNPYCHSHYYSFDWDTDSLICFRQKQTFLSIKKIFCFTNCIFLVITITYSAKYLGTFRSTKDIVKKCLSDKGENYVLFSYARTVPSLVFYSGKNILQIEDYTRWKTIIPNPETSAYVVMSLNDYQKKHEWIQKGNSMPYARITPMLY